MRIDANRCPLVLTGSWSQAIFSIPFVLENVFEGAEEIKAEMGLADGNLVLRFQGGGMTFIVQGDRVSWIPAETSNPTLSRVEESANRLVNRLSITPLSGRGLNYGFNVENPSTIIGQLLDPPDLTKLQGLATSDSVGLTLKRTWQAGDDVVSVTMSRQREDTAVAIDLNFHRNVNTAQATADSLKGAVVSCRDRALEILDKVYDVRLEEVKR